MTDHRVPDDRFADDLRSVLLDDAPAEVPERLRQRVAGIPASVSIERPRPGRLWRLSAPVLVGAAVVVAVVLVGAWRLGAVAPAGVGGSGPPTASASASVVGTHDCRAADLVAAITGWEGAAGSRIAAIEVRNDAGGPCRLATEPRLELIDANGRVLIGPSAGPAATPSASDGVAGLELAAAGRALTDVEASNVCGASPALPLSVVFMMSSDGGRLVAAPAAGVSSADATPPCNGVGGGHIAMNGWVSP